MDGALAGSSRKLESDRMGAGWIVRNKEEIGSNFSFSCSIENWPLSTRAELEAIWAALLTVLVGLKYIYLLIAKQQ